MYEAPGDKDVLKKLELLDRFSCSSLLLRYRISEIPWSYEMFIKTKSFNNNVNRCAATWVDIIKVASQVLKEQT